MSGARFVRYSIAALAVATVLAALPAAAAAQSSGVAQSAGHTHPRLGTSGSSQNWAGYDATGGRFSSVTATWTQPLVASSGATNSYAAFWVGLDGDGSKTVEQIGTEGYSVGGVVFYDAWFEMYPKFPVTVPLTISPGDVLTGTVTSGTRGAFTLTLADLTTGQTFTTKQTLKQAKRYSAEVIAEAPWSGGVLPLADFGSVNFSGAAFNGQPVSAFNWTKIDMVAGGGITKAATSSLDGSGSGFSIQWLHY
jgi:hypothetical protein